MVEGTEIRDEATGGRDALRNHGNREGHPVAGRNAVVLTGPDREPAYLTGPGRYLTITRTVVDDELLASPVHDAWTRMPDDLRHEFLTRRRESTGWLPYRSPGADGIRSRCWIPIDRW
jgi:hypothetical protein